MAGAALRLGGYAPQFFPVTASKRRREAHPGSSTQWTWSLSVFLMVPSLVTRK
jgi:hypothetical protein